jgi:hypothetical protein
VSCQAVAEAYYTPALVRKNRAATPASKHT